MACATNDVQKYCFFRTFYQEKSDFCGKRQTKIRQK